MPAITRILASANNQSRLGNFAAAVALIEQAQLLAVDLGAHALADDLFNIYVAAKIKAFG